MRWFIFETALLIAWSATAFAHQDTERQIPQTDSSYIDADGTAHVTRVVPVPGTISPEAQKTLSRRVSDAPVQESLAERRSKTDAWQSKAGEQAQALYPVNVAKDNISGGSRQNHYSTYNSGKQAGSGPGESARRRFQLGLGLVK